MGGLLWTIISVLVVLWLIGFVVHIGGSGRRVSPRAGKVHFAVRLFTVA